MSFVSNRLRHMARSYGKPFQGAIAAVVLGLAGALVPMRPAVAAEDQTFCVLVPHFKDEYWLSVGYGLEQEAARRDIRLLIFEAGGYRSRERQIAQLQDCGDRQVDAILLGAVTSDHPDLLAAIAQVSRDVPVFGLVNELHAPELRAMIGVDWMDMGLVLGRFLAARHPGGAAPKTAVLISGPPESGWIAPLEKGLRHGLDGSALHLTAVFGADTGLRQQLTLVEEAFGQFPDVDYLIGSAPAVEAAIGVLERTAPATRPLLVSTYISHTIKRGLMNGQVLATPFDNPMEQGRVAIQMADDKLLHRAGGFIGPQVVLLTRNAAEMGQARLSPSDYFPAIE